MKITFLEKKKCVLLERRDLSPRCWWFDEGNETYTQINSLQGNKGYNGGKD